MFKTLGTWVGLWLIALFAAIFDTVEGWLGIVLAVVYAVLAGIATILIAFVFEWWPYENDDYDDYDDYGF